MCGAYFFELRGRNLVCFIIAYNFNSKFVPEAGKIHMRTTFFTRANSEWYVGCWCDWEDTTVIAFILHQKEFVRLETDKLSIYIVIGLILVVLLSCFKFNALWSGQLKFHSKGMLWISFSRQTVTKIFSDWSRFPLRFTQVSDSFACRVVIKCFLLDLPVGPFSLRQRNLPENAALFPPLGLSSTPTRHEKGSFRKRVSNRRNFKPPASHFKMDVSNIRFQISQAGLVSTGSKSERPQAFNSSNT